MNWRGILTRNWFGEKELSPFLFTITISEDMAGILFASSIALLPVPFFLILFFDLPLDILLYLLILWLFLDVTLARKRAVVYDSVILLLVFGFVEFYYSFDRSFDDYIYIVTAVAAAVLGVLIVVIREIKTYRDNRAKREALLPVQ